MLLLENVYMFSFLKTLHCCSSSVQPLSERPGIGSCLFKAPPPDKALCALIGQLAYFVVIGQLLASSTCRKSEVVLVGVSDYVFIRFNHGFCDDM